MFRIGEFSRLAHVSTRLLRHYDELGLLRPDEVEPRTGYRHYRAAQLGDLHRILVLRDLGFSLEQIGMLMQGKLDPEQLRAMLLARRAEVAREMEVSARRLEELSRRLDDEAAGEAVGDVLVRSLPASSYLSARVQLDGVSEALTLISAMQRELPRRLGSSALGQMMVIQHAESFEPDELDLELGFCLKPGVARDTAAEVMGHAFAVRVLPEVEEAAVCVRVGPPEAVHAQAQAVARAVEAGGYCLAGPNRELFLQAARDAQPPVIEMQFPVRRV